MRSRVIAATTALAFMGGLLAVMPASANSPQSGGGIDTVNPATTEEVVEDQVTTSEQNLPEAETPLTDDEVVTTDIPVSPAANDDVDMNVDVTILPGAAGTPPFASAYKAGEATGELFTGKTVAGRDDKATIVRVNDTVTFEVALTANSTTLTDAVFKLELPKGLYLTAMPGACQEGSTLSPEDPFKDVTWPINETVNEDKVKAQTLTCVRGDFANKTETFNITAKLGNLVPNEHIYAITSATFSGSTVDGPKSVAESVAKLPAIQASSALKWNLSKNGVFSEPNTSGIQSDAALACPQDDEAACKFVQYQINLSTPAGGKGAMPAIGDISWKDNLTYESLLPELSTTDLAKIKANQSKYKIRLVFTDTTQSTQPQSKNNNTATSNAENSVIDSGVWNGEYVDAGALRELSLKGTNFSMVTVPIEDRQGNPLPQIDGGIPSYVMSLRALMYVPEDLVREFGTRSGSALQLKTHNQFEQLNIKGFNGTIQTENYSLPEWLYQDISVYARANGSFSKQFVGVPGTKNNTPALDFYKYNYWMGPPGGAGHWSGEITVMPGQNIYSNLLVNADGFGGVEQSRLLCDSWNNTQMVLRGGESLKTVPTPSGTFQRIPSATGAPVWMSKNTSVAKSPKNVRIQYAYAPVSPENAQQTRCGNTIDGKAVTWYDSPEQVPGKVPVKQGNDMLYPAVNRVRIFADYQPNTDSSQGAAANSIGWQISLQITDSMESQPVGTIIPNYAASLADLEGTHSFTSMVNGTSGLSWNSAGLPLDGAPQGRYDRVNLVKAQVRINKEAAVTKVTEKPTKWEKNASQSAVALQNDIHFRLSPQITSAGQGGGTYPVVVEDCLPANLKFESSSRSPNVNTPWTASQSVAGGKKCEAGETYLRWNLGNKQVNDPITPITVTSSIRPEFDAGLYTNHATVSSTADDSAVELRTSDATYRTDIIKQIFVAKRLLTPEVQINRTGQSTNEQMKWENILYNGTDQKVGRSDMIDVLPKTGYQGTLSLNSATTNIGEVWYTSAANVNGDPKNASNSANGATTWCSGFTGSPTVKSGSGNAASCPKNGSQVTAIRWVFAAGLDKYQTMEGTVTATAVGNKAGDEYVSSVRGYAIGLTDTVGPATVTPVVLQSSIGDQVWWDYANTGIQPATGMAGAAGVTVKLTGKDDLGNTLNLSTTTNANGIYHFQPLRSSDSAGYTVTFVKPENASRFSKQKQGTDKAKWSLPAQATGIAAGIVLPVNTVDNDVDAGLIARTDFRIEKLGHGERITGSQWQLQGPSPATTTVSPKVVTGMTPTGSVMQFDNVDPGTYTLTEIKAPDGYQLLAKPITVVVSYAGVVSINAGSGASISPAGDGTIQMITVSDVSEFSFPDTGYIGWPVASLAVLIIAASVALLYFVYRWMEKNSASITLK